MPKALRPHRRRVAASPTSGSALPILERDADIRAGIKSLRRRCPAIRHMHETVGEPALRRHAPGFAGLARVVVGQQLSTASAGAIWTRTAAAVVPFEAEMLLAQDIAVLKGAGLSQGKIRTLRATAEAIVSGALDLDEPLSDAALREQLLAIPGIGPWTADIYVMFSLGHADGFAPGDLALQIAAQRAFGLEAKPLARELEEIAERWRPWRNVAAHLLWAFYAHRDVLRSS